MSGLLGHYEDSDDNEDAPGSLAAQEAAAKDAADATSNAPKAAAPSGSPPQGQVGQASASPPQIVATGDDSSDEEGSGAKGDEGEDMLLPPSPGGPPDADILERVKSLHDLRKRGKSIRDHIQGSRDWSNPYILERVVKVFELEQYGSNFPKEIFDPSRVAEHPSDWFDAPECERPPAPKKQKKAGNDGQKRNGLSRAKSNSGLGGGDSASDLVVS
mmetsp:Transcript_11986/g.21217  ORF Transcript_11986/g.21217 Transcript_11986/m.21217 type:complete len:216 (-) Transcript_11986:117-764(-)